MSKLILGCIADDFTGGSDAASFLAAGGMNTVLLSEIPGPDLVLPDDVRAAVITLKSRTQETGAAVADSLAAIRWLLDAGASHFYVKYCSTFDSTPDGNIGPIVDAVLEELSAEGTILCPALPANERVVRDGVLYVKGIPLAESPMKDHPLTPMWESRISLLMEPQGKYRSLELHKDALDQDDDCVRALIDTFTQGITPDAESGQKHWYLIPDYVDDRDAERLAHLFGGMKVLTGGSGILTALARRFMSSELPQEASSPSCQADRERPACPFPAEAGGAAAYEGTDGPAVIVAGSCSVATHAQTTRYEKDGGDSFRLSDEGIASGAENPVSIWEKMSFSDAPLIYCYDTPEGLKKKRNEAGRQLAAKIEAALAGTAAYAMKHGVTRIIAAGGETSGAVTQALGYKAYRIGRSVAPGVPVMTPLENPSIRLVLKSGNFGQEDFFERALKLTGKEK